jgi:hypothetical protein
MGINKLNAHAAKLRRQFDKELNAALGRHVKGSGWKKSGPTLFAKVGENFHEVNVSVYLNDDIVRVTHAFKPMALDPILWDIMAMSENVERPLSFRSNGAFTCASLPICETTLEQVPGIADEMAASIVKWATDNLGAYATLQQPGGFSDLLTQHPNQIARGAYATTLVVSLINDENLEAAAHVASSYASGTLTSCHQFASHGIPFHQLALDWLRIYPSSECPPYWDRFLVPRS